MRKSWWVIALLVAAIAAPTAYADSFDASFTCSTTCSSVPTDPATTFPSPVIPISFASEVFSITLNALDLPTDSYTWSVQVTSSGWNFSIEDVTTGLIDVSQSFSSSNSNGDPSGNGLMILTAEATATPEPNTFALLLLGVATVLALGKFLGRRLPTAS